MEGEQGQCGICNLTGPLDEIQAHFLSEHVNDDENVVNEERNTSCDGDVSDCIRWVPHNVLLLIRLVEENSEKFNTSMKKQVWMHIAKQISHMSGKTVTPEQVDNKWKGLKKTYKKIKDQRCQTGSSTTRWEFFNAMDSFMGKRPEVTPVAVCSTGSGLTINEDQLKKSVNNEEPSSSSSSFMMKRKRRVNDIQKRHEEKMSRFDDFLSLYKQSVQHQLRRKPEPDDE